MKILVVSKGNLPSRSANSIHLFKMAKAFTNLGHDVCLITKFGSNKRKLNRFYGDSLIQFKYLFFFSNKSINFFFRYFNLIILRIYLIFNKFDFIFTRELSIIKTIPINIPVIWETHNYNLTNNEKLLYKKLNVITVITITQELQIYLQKNNISSLVFNDGYDASNIIPIHKLNNVVTFTGHLYKNRGIDQLLECARILPDIPFHIYGGNDDDINYWKSKKLPHNFHLKGFIPPSRIQDIQSNSLILIINYSKNLNTSEYCSPLKLNEYISTKNIVICTRFGPITEKYQERLLLIDADNNDTLCKTLQNTWDNRTKIINKIRSKNDFSEGLTWIKRAEKILSYALSTLP